MLCDIEGLARAARSLWRTTLISPVVPESRAMSGQVLS